MAIGSEPPTRNPITLARRLVTGGVALARLEVARGKAEMTANLGQLRGGVIKIVIAIAILVAIVIELIAFVVSLLVSAGLWWVALLTIIALVVVAILLGWRGLRDIQGTTFTPEETIASVKEDIAWAKTRLLKRD